MTDFTLGNWYLPGVPPDWEIMTGYGIRRIAGFPSVLLFAVEPMPASLTLDLYIAKQMNAAKVLFHEPKVRESTVITVSGAAEARQIGLSWTSQDGRQVVQIQIYATDGEMVGNTTFTTLETELPDVAHVLRSMMAQLRFVPAPRDTTETAPPAR